MRFASEQEYITYVTVQNLDENCREFCALHATQPHISRSHRDNKNSSSSKRVKDQVTERRMTKVNSQSDRFGVKYSIVTSISDRKVCRLRVWFAREGLDIGTAHKTIVRQGLYKGRSMLAGPVHVVASIYTWKLRIEGRVECWWRRVLDFERIWALGQHSPIADDLL